MTTIPPTPFPRKGVTPVQPRCSRLLVSDLLLPWGGPAEAA